jgi:hypothetical protein
MDDEAPIARYDPTAGTVRLRLTGGEEVVVGGLGPELPIWRVAGGQPPSGPLWLSADQADVLGKMIEYILTKVKISAPSQAVLQDLAPQVAQLRDEMVAAGAASDEDYYDDDTAGP